MSRYQIYYYTRTGRSEKVAKKLAEKYSTTAYKISDNENWSGVVGFIKGGAKAAKKELSSITYEKPQQDKKLVVVFPIWAGSFPPALNAFFEEQDKSKVILVATSLGTKFKDRASYEKVIDLVGKDIFDIEVDLG